LYAWIVDGDDDDDDAKDEVCDAGDGNIDANNDCGNADNDDDGDAVADRRIEIGSCSVA
jgi:hypothetical protein